MHRRTWKLTKLAFRAVTSKYKIIPVNLAIAAWELGVWLRRKAVLS